MAEVIVLKESLAQSIARDAVTFVTCAGLVGLGWWIGSDAMQWIGGVMFVFSLAVRMAGVVQKNKFTIAEARKRLDEIEATSK